MDLLGNSETSSQKVFSGRLLCGVKKEDFITSVSDVTEPREKVTFAEKIRMGQITQATTPTKLLGMFKKV